MTDRMDRWNDGRSVVSFPEEGVLLLLRVTHLGGERYRLDEVPFGVESAGFRDEVELERLESGALRLVRVLRRSGWTTIDHVLDPRPRGGDPLARVARIGGDWQPLHEGRLLLCIPPGRELEPEEETEDERLPLTA